MKQTSHFGYKSGYKYPINNYLNNTTKPTQFIRKIQPYINNDQKRRVTFEVQNRNQKQQILPTNKPNYESYNSVPQQNEFKLNLNRENQIKANQPVKSHIEFVDAENQENQQPQQLYSFVRDKNNNNQKNTQERSKSTYNRPPIWRNSRSPSNNKKLRIFPQNYQGQQKSQKNSPDKQTQQIKKLQKQIQKLRQQLRSQSMVKTSSYHDSKSQTISKDSDTFNLQRLEAERTKRLSELNSFNQTLYNELAVKLKQVSNTQQEICMVQANIKKMFLQQILQHSASAKKQQQFQQGLYNQTDGFLSHKQTIHNTVNKQKINKMMQKQTLNNVCYKQKNNNDFIDIKQFEQRYQHEYNQSKMRNSHSNQNIFKNETNSTLPMREENIISPFLIKENNNRGDDFEEQKLEEKMYFQKTMEKYHTINQMTRNNRKYQAFTFNKENLGKPRHFSKDKYQRYQEKESFEPQKLVLNSESTQKQGNQNQFKQQQFLEEPTNIFANRTLKSKNRDIRDLNSQIQQKIIRKRINSYFGKSRSGVRPLYK